MLLVGCAPGDSVLQGEPLLAPEAWVQGDPATDPLDGLARDCPPSTWGAEGGRLEVQTGACAQAWLVQPLPVDLAPGDVLTVSSWHQGLDAAEAGEGHLALVIDGQLVWEVWAPIPSDPELFDGRFVAHRFVPAGADVGVHLHNHGYNSWSVGEVVRWRAQGSEP